MPEKTPPIVEEGIVRAPILKEIDPEKRKIITQLMANTVKSNNLRFFRDKCDI